MYPMMPHMTVSSALVLSHLLPHALGPARLDHLPGPPERQRVRRHVLRHDRARPDHAPAPARKCANGPTVHSASSRLPSITQLSNTVTPSPSTLSTSRLCERITQSSPMTVRPSSVVCG